MCFGPVSSFAASSVLASLGTVILRNIRSRKEILFAAFPLLFAVQQFIEGIVWLVLRSGQHNDAIHGLTFAYLTFAYSLWPVLCPLSVYMIEYDPGRKRALRLLILSGVVTSLYLLFFIVAHPTDAVILNCSIRYETFVVGAPWFTGIYVMATLVPYFLSSHRSILIFGLPNVLFCALAYFAYRAAFISVWCFFAAVLSLTLYVFLRKLHHQPVLPLPHKH